MIKKRTRPQTRVRATSTEQDDEPQVAQDEEEAGLPCVDYGNFLGFQFG